MSHQQYLFLDAKEKVLQSAFGEKFSVHYLWEIVSITLESYRDEIMLLVQHDWALIQKRNPVTSSGTTRFEIAKIPTMTQLERWDAIVELMAKATMRLENDSNPEEIELSVYLEQITLLLKNSGRLT